VTVVLGLALENDLLHAAHYVAVDVRSSRNEQIAATNAWLHADSSQRPPRIDGQPCSPWEPRAPITCVTRSGPFLSLLNMPTDSYAVSLLSRNFVRRSAQQAGRLNDACADVGTNIS
jgi:hypothetical protein